MKLHEIVDNEHIIVHLINRLLDKGHDVKFNVNRSGDDYEVSVAQTTSSGKWVTLEYGIPNERTGDINTWGEADFEEDKITLVKHGNEWWVEEIE